MDLIELLKVILIGIVEGITEWLPISSTGHMILVDEFISLTASEEFKEMFFVVIQLGAIIAVCYIYFQKLLPISINEGKVELKKETMTLWYKIIFACIPAAVIGLAFDDYIEEKLFNSTVVAIMLIVYGIAYVIVESKERKVSVDELNNLSFKTAFLIGMFQVLALIPGTSRSGATIIGAMLLGTSRIVAAEFTFFLAIPVMFGASLLKLVKFGLNFTTNEMIILGVGMITAYFVSILAIRFLMKYIKKNNFKIFGWYRIVLGIIVLAYFMITKS